MSPTQTTRPKSEPPVTRRSARQERIARRHPERDLQRASTKGKKGGPSPILIGTIIAVIAGVALIGYTIVSRGGIENPLPTISAPAFITDASIPHDDSKMQLGNSDAKVKVEVWEDYRCSACGTFSRSVEPDLVRDYIQTGKAYLVWHDYTIIDQNDGTLASRDAANAARCAGDQGKLWQYHDWLFFNQDATESPAAVSIDRLIEFGRKMGGLDMTKFEQCVRNGTHNADVQASIASRPSDVTGTPTIHVNGTAVPFTGKIDPLKTAIDGALTATPAPSGSAAPSPSASGSASVAPSASLLLFGLPLLRRRRQAA